jgi:hypothetical protein
MTKKFLNVKELSLYTGLSISTIHKLTSKKKIAHFCPGGKLKYFDVDVVDAFIMSNPVKTATEINSEASAFIKQLNLKGGKKW